MTEVGWKDLLDRMIKSDRAKVRVPDSKIFKIRPSFLKTFYSQLAMNLLSVFSYKYLLSYFLSFAWCGSVD